MAKRREFVESVVLKDNTVLKIRVLTNIYIEDLLIQGMKAEGYRVAVGKDIFPKFGRVLKDLLIVIGAIR